jgi:DNA-binding beta-propeller fold protein YncE
VEGEWLTRLAVVNTESGRIETSAEFRGTSTYGFLGLAPDGSAVALDQRGEGGTRTRIFDVKTNSLVDPIGPALVQKGFATLPAFSPDGRWLFRFDAGDIVSSSSTDLGEDTPYVVALDLVDRRTVKIALPKEHKSSDFEKYLLWSLALTPDGSTLYAVNPALGIVDEIDARQMSLRRTGQITVSRADHGALARLGGLLFPSADAKRYVVGGAVLSPDRRVLYAAAHDGISVVDTVTLGSRQVWQTKHWFDYLALSADGSRLYAIDNANSALVMIDTRDGTSLGEIKLSAYAPAIVRIDSVR